MIANRRFEVDFSKSDNSIISIALRMILAENEIWIFPDDGIAMPSSRADLHVIKKGHEKFGIIFIRRK